MSRKTVSLQEFFRSHESNVHTHNNLPVRPRHDRDDDQGLHLRLAQSCSLDSGKAYYPQRHGPSKEGPQYAEHSSYGSYGSSDGTPVGDVDYHRPHGHHDPAGSFHSSGSNSYYARKQGPPRPGPSPHDRPGQYSYEPTGAYSRGPVSPPSMPPVGGPPGAGPMGPPVHSGGVRGNYGPGPGYGHPPQHTYGPPGSYGMPPQHGCGAPGAYAAPPDAAAVPRPPPREPAGVPGPMGRYGGAPRCPPSYGPPTGVYGAPPPPPPPPRQLPPQQAPVERAPAAYMSDRTVAGPESVKPAVAHMDANVQPLAAPPPPRPVATAQADRPAAAAMQPAASAAAPAVARKTTPFATPEPEPKPAAEALAAPKNEFAERLAQRAMASAARAKSSLLAGGGSGSCTLSSADSLGRRDSLASSVGKPPVRGMSLDIPATAASGPDSSGSSPIDPSGVFVKPSHPFGRPKLALKPRSVPMDAAVSASGNYSSTSSDSGDAPAEHGSGSTAGSVASSVGGGRPRLNLLPRGSSLPDSSAGASTTAGARKPSVFGDAKPREEVLKQRGLDPALVDAAVEIGRAHVEAPAARQGSMGERVSRSSEEDEWHQVSAHGRKGSAAHRDVRTLPEDAFDPFFGSSGSAKIPSHSEYVSVPPARAFSRDIMREGYGASRHYGSPGNRASGYAVDADDDDGAGVFRRALPTRQVPLAL